MRVCVCLRIPEEDAWQASKVERSSSRLQGRRRSRRRSQGRSQTTSKTRAFEVNKKLSFIYRLGLHLPSTSLLLSLLLQFVIWATLCLCSAPLPPPHTPFLPSWKRTRRYVCFYNNNDKFVAYQRHVAWLVADQVAAGCKLLAVPQSRWLGLSEHTLRNATKGNWFAQKKRCMQHVADLSWQAWVASWASLAESNLWLIGLVVQQKLKREVAFAQCVRDGKEKL